jgi:antitoxin HigA-1
MTIRKSTRLQPIHPGEVLQEVLSDAGLTVNALALALRVPANRIGGIVKGQRGISGDTALRLLFWNIRSDVDEPASEV